MKARLDTCPQGLEQAFIDRIVAGITNSQHMQQGIGGARVADIEALMNETLAIFKPMVGGCVNGALWTDGLEEPFTLERIAAHHQAKTAGMKWVTLKAHADSLEASLASWDSAMKWLSVKPSEEQNAFEEATNVAIRCARVSKAEASILMNMCTEPNKDMMASKIKAEIKALRNSKPQLGEADLNTHVWSIAKTCLRGR